MCKFMGLSASNFNFNFFVFSPPFSFVQEGFDSGEFYAMHASRMCSLILIFVANTLAAPPPPTIRFIDCADVCLSVHIYYMQLYILTDPDR